MISIFICCCIFNMLIIARHIFEINSLKVQCGEFEMNDLCVSKKIFGDGDLYR